MNKKDLKYEWLRGGKSSFPIGLAASQAIADQSGKFIDMSGGYGHIATDASTYLIGWVEMPGHYTPESSTGVTVNYFTSSATAGATVVNCIRDLTAVFRMPLQYSTATYTTNYAATLIGYLRDIYYDTTLKTQGADMTNGTDDFLVVVGGLAATTAGVLASSNSDGYVDVMMNPAISIGV